VIPILLETIKTLIFADDFMELLNKTSVDLSAVDGLKLTELYDVATQNQSVFLQEYVPNHILYNMVKGKNGNGKMQLKRATEKWATGQMGNRKLGNGNIGRRKNWATGKFEQLKYAA